MGTGKYKLLVSCMKVSLSMEIFKEREKWFTKQDSYFKEGLIIIKKYREL